MPVGGATNRDVELTTELESPAGWSSDVITTSMAEGETAEVQVVITAPAETAPGAAELTSCFVSPAVNSSERRSR